jgi:hypothetical protein
VGPTAAGRVGPLRGPDRSSGKPAAAHDIRREVARWRTSPFHASSVATGTLARSEFARPLYVAAMNWPGIEGGEQRPERCGGLQGFKASAAAEMTTRLWLHARAAVAVRRGSWRARGQSDGRVGGRTPTCRGRVSRYPWWQRGDQVAGPGARRFPTPRTARPPSATGVATGPRPRNEVGGQKQRPVRLGGGATRPYAYTLS